MREERERNRERERVCERKMGKKERVRNEKE